MMDYEELYNTCPDFRAFVDRCMHASGRSREETLAMHTIRDVGDYMAERMEEQSKVTRVDMVIGCGGTSDDKTDL